MTMRTVVFRLSCIDGPHQFAQRQVDSLAGEVFNVGGGTANAMSLLEVLELVSRNLGQRPAIEDGNWRTDDQRYYVSDAARFTRATGWEPAVPVAEGIHRLATWLQQQEAPGAR